LPFVNKLTCVPTVRLEDIEGHIRASKRAIPFIHTVSRVPANRGDNGPEARSKRVPHSEGGTERIHQRTISAAKRN